MSTLLAVALILLSSLLALGGVLLLLLKLGVIGHYYTKPDPVDQSDGHTLAQSREAGRPATPPQDDM